MQAKILKYDELPGVPAIQISEHFALYEDIVKSYNELPGDDTEKNRLLNIARMHEAYFDCMGGTGRVGGHMIDLLERDFGSLDDWERQFRDLAQQAGEWLVLAYDLEDNVLRFVFCNDSEALWNCVALIVFDAHEHAYSKMDDKNAYVETFIKNIDWEYVNTLLGRYGIR